MKTIIIATDFSPVATNAMQFGIDMAKSINARVLLLNVYHVPATVADTQVVMVTVEDLEKNAEEKLEELKNELERATIGALEIKTAARLGTVTDELETLCEEVEPFAIVMGTHGVSAIEKILFGSNTLSVIRHINWPVICVPPGKSFGNGIRKIGFACDFSHVAETTPLHIIKDFVQTFNAELHVLNIDFHDRHFKPDTPGESFHLHSMLEGLKPSYHFIGSKDVEEGINEFSEKNNLDLLIAIPKKHKLLEGLFKPSATKQLVFHSHIPVLCVHE